MHFETSNQSEDDALEELEELTFLETFHLYCDGLLDPAASEAMRRRLELDPAAREAAIESLSIVASLSIHLGDRSKGIQK